MEDDVRQSIKDDEQLKLLSIGYYISAATTGFFSLFGLMYICLGIVFATAIRHSPHNPSQAPPAFMIYVFTGVGTVIFVVGVSLALLKWRVGRCIAKRRSPLFCQIVAGVSCLSVPWGTVVGVCTFVLLNRPSVARLFAQGSETKPDVSEMEQRP
ncbi:MAG TPA: hypothetical protein VEZ11_05140 [Thermoanaerobaculia bacterium]|nr:hypothetical protein [Thermoanaerobaculia bacterium]